LAGNSEAANRGSIPAFAVVGVIGVHDVELFPGNVRFIAHAGGSDVETGLVGIVTEVFENGGVDQLRLSGDSA
jgi:hypothetical protein